MKPENKFYFKKNKTIYYNKNGKRFEVVCNPKDTYDKKLGMLYVLAKANGIDWKEIDLYLEENKKPKFKIGDRVVLVNKCNYIYDGIKVGTYGYIADITNAYYWVVFDDFGTQFMNVKDANKYLQQVYL